MSATQAELAAQATGAAAAAKRGRPKKEPLYGADRFTVSSKQVDRPFPYGQDAGYEIALKVMRWFWYTEKVVVGLGVVKNAKDVMLLMESIYRKITEKQVPQSQWPGVLELIYRPKIAEFIEMHRAELSDLNLIS